MSHQLYSLLQYECTPPDQPPGGSTEAPVVVKQETAHAHIIEFPYYTVFLITGTSGDQP